MFSERLQRLIKRGEFTFCSRCGEICKRTDKDFMCIWCGKYLFSRDRSEQEQAELRLEMYYEQMCSDVHKEHREALAVMRDQWTG